jgi:DNA repair protein RecN (Recombination protein N)
MAGLVRHGQAQGQVTAVFDLPPGHPAPGAEVAGLVHRRRSDLAPRADGGRAHARLHQRSAGECAGAAQRLARRWWKFTASMTSGRWSMPARHRALVDAFGGLEGDAAEVSRLHAGWRAAEAEFAGHRARVAAARKEADYLRHAADELTKLAPAAREERSLRHARTGR